MTEPKTRRKGSEARGGHPPGIRTPFPFDFNDKPQPVSVHAARFVNEAALAQLFVRLEEANEYAARSGTSRAAALGALRAVVEFIVANPINGNGRFSRPLELLWTELNGAGAPASGEILPSRDARGGGTHRRNISAYTKAAAAATVELLRRTKRPVNAAAAEVAAALSVRGFPFGSRASNKANAVKAWRRDYAGVGRSLAVQHYRRLCKTPPVTLIDDVVADRAAIWRWLSAELERAGYVSPTSGHPGNQGQPNGPQKAKRGRTNAPS